jgi:SAM-dependent methyltransferase
VDLQELQRNWHEFGRRNALGSIFTLTAPEGELPEWDRDEFFETGVREIESALGYLDSLGVEVPRDRALDFGCGVGRLTQALGRNFAECAGVDIAPSMIELARDYNTLGDRCTYHLNDRDDLRLFQDDSFDFIYSTVVLQHIAPEYTRNYIREFVRVLRPGGVALFDVPSEPVPPAEALATEAYRADISLVDVPWLFPAGTRQTLRARVKNSSPRTWSGARVPDSVGELRLGNHWLDRRGHVMVRDDGRAALPRDVEPGGVVELAIDVCVPDRLGACILELDLLQEGVSWFAEKGSGTRKLAGVIVPGLPRLRALRERLARRERPERSPAGDGPRMEMHAVNRAEVVELVERSGGRVVSVDESAAAGASWIGFRYCVTK